MREKTPNHKLAALMREASVSRKGMAARIRAASQVDGKDVVSTTHTLVGKWLSGEVAQPSPRNCELAIEVLSERLGRPVSVHDLGYEYATAEAADRTLEYPTTTADSIMALTQLSAYELTSDRSSTLHVVPEAWATLLVKAMFGSDGVDPVPGSHQLSGIDVQAVRDATEMFATFDYRYGGGQPKPLVAKFLESSVLPTIAVVSPESALGREYFAAVAALTRLAGWTAYDTGQHGLAQRYLYQAFRLARAAGDKALCGRILAGMSHQANFLGHFDHAVHLARAATHGAQGFATPTAMALFSAMEARALASLGNERETTVALMSAEGWLSQSQPDNDPSWIRYFDSAELHAEFAHCFRELGKAQASNEHATASIAESENLYVRSLSFVRTVLATSHLHAGDADQALNIAKGVVDTAAHLGSYRVRSYLEDFQQRLRAVDELAGQDFGSYMVRTLPAA